jgi:DNA-binding NarL/FixJ family response regulator
VTSAVPKGEAHADATMRDRADAAVVTSAVPKGEAHADATTRSAAVVVDELALVRLGLATLLGSLAVEPPIAVVAETPSGRDAAERLRDDEADLVVIGAPADMPVTEAVRRARAASDAIFIVALLGTAQVGSVAAVVTAGANGVALRGAAPAELAEALEVVLGGGRFVAAMLSSGLLGQLEAVAPDPRANGNDLLTYREREVLALLAGGATNREIAASLSVTLATVKSHLVHIYAKLEVRNRHEALSRAVSLGLLA